MVYRGNSPLGCVFAAIVGALTLALVVSAFLYLLVVAAGFGVLAGLWMLAAHWWRSRHPRPGTLTASRARTIDDYNNRLLKRLQSRPAPQERSEQQQEPTERDHLFE